MGIFYQQKAFHTGKKIWKNDFAPSEKYSSYAPESKEVSKVSMWHHYDLIYVKMVKIGKNAIFVFDHKRLKVEEKTLWGCNNPW